MTSFCCVLFLLDYLYRLNVLMKSVFIYYIYIVLTESIHKGFNATRLTLVWASLQWTTKLIYNWNEFGDWQTQPTNHSKIPNRLKIPTTCNEWTFYLPLCNNTQIILMYCKLVSLQFQTSQYETTCHVSNWIVGTRPKPLTTIFDNWFYTWIGEWCSLCSKITNWTCHDYYNL